MLQELLTAEEQRAVKELNEMEIPVVIQLENDLITAPPQTTSRHTNRYAGLLVAVGNLQSPSAC